MNETIKDQPEPIADESLDQAGGIGLLLPSVMRVRAKPAKDDSAIDTNPGSLSAPQG